MGAINWSELFPEKWSGVIFVSYMALFVNQGIIVTWSQSKGEYDYNIVAVVLVTEVLKLLVSACLYCWDNKISLLLREIAKHKHVLLLYMVPSFLYCLYNNLAFVNLAVFDPTTYYLLLQFRVVITGIIFQVCLQRCTENAIGDQCCGRCMNVNNKKTERILNLYECCGGRDSEKKRIYKIAVVFDKRLSTKQWLSLVLLTLGCMMKHLDLGLESPSFFTKIQLNINILFIFVQTICSCLAGVYNEYLLKGQGAKIDIFLQNVFMYIDSIVCNILVLGVQGNPSAAFENIASNILLRPKVMAIVVNNAAIGITTSLFLKKLNSILKTFASALELVFTAILCWLIFDIPIYLNTIVAIAMVSYAVILYSQNPVQNHNPKAKSSCTDEESILST